MKQHQAGTALPVGLTQKSTKKRLRGLCNRTKMLLVVYEFTLTPVYILDQTLNHVQKKKKTYGKLSKIEQKNVFIHIFKKRMK